MRTCIHALFAILSPALCADWKLVWSDEFNGSKLDYSKWGIEENAFGGGNHEQQIYTDRSKNVRVENGSLILKRIRITPRSPARSDLIPPGAFAPSIGVTGNTVRSRCAPSSQPDKACGPQSGCCPRMKNTALGLPAAKLILWNSKGRNPPASTARCITVANGPTTGTPRKRWIYLRVISPNPFTPLAWNGNKVNPLDLGWQNLANADEVEQQWWCLSGTV